MKILSDYDTLPFPMRFKINRKKLIELARFRGWRAIYTPLAREMGFTVSYCRRVVLEQEKLTDYFMLKYIKVAGCNSKVPTEWASLFDVCLEGDIPLDQSPAWNTTKLNGQGKPYRLYSPSYAFRKKFLEENPHIEEEESV